MKTLLILPFLFFIYVAALVQNTDAIASCCTTERGCTGSAYCTACKNCTGCRHCAKNGGSCGVCSPRSSSVSRPSSFNTKKPTFRTGDILVVSAETLNLRKGPGTKYDVLKKLAKNEKLELVEASGSWIRVKLLNKTLSGYVFKKYVIKQ
ncbi:SH3 domain-containing protein [Aureisphaera galaxeae]|uniref:SH3 domain-containing protein n=1 Tax=Aureisphaera galaxeae TaxID=1538023 RepID=UPI0023503037|nr:SH3 domain-containing protein [Aureisphaera galaxeae]MDC8002731.1 SH3 domain-containing protein [Aureisphaera galaxeae]